MAIFCIFVIVNKCHEMTKTDNVSVCFSALSDLCCFSFVSIEDINL